MKKPVKLLAALALAASSLAPGATAIGRAPRSVFCPVLIYHHVKWLKASDDAIERGLTVLPTQFNAELNYLASHGYHPVSANRLVAYLRTGAPLPPKPVVITFDDGYNDAYTTTYRLLRKHHMVATFFIVPGLLDKPRYMTWTQVEAMSKHGMDMEAHSMTHPDLLIVPAAQMRGEIIESRHVLQSKLHKAVRIFAYPYGDYDAAVLSVVKKAGYWAAFTTHEGWRPAETDLLTLPRVYVDLDDTLPIFAGRLVANPRVLAEDPT